MSESSYVVQVDCTDDGSDSALVVAWYYSRQPPLRISALEPWVKNKEIREDYQNDFANISTRLSWGICNNNFSSLILF